MRFGWKIEVKYRFQNYSDEKCRELAYKMGIDREKVDSLLAEIAQDPKVMLHLENLKAKFEGV